MTQHMWWGPAGGSPPPLLDLAAFYRETWIAIDFLILFSLFAGIAGATIGRRLGGREGKLASVAIALALAVSSVALESSRGFNLTVLGGVAVLILALAAAVVTLRLLRAAGLGTGLALSLALIGLGVASVAVEPGSRLMPVLHAIRLAAVLALGLLIIRFALTLSHGRGGRLSRIAGDLESSNSRAGNLKPERLGSFFARLLKRKQRQLEQELAPIVRREAEGLRQDPRRAANSSRLPCARVDCRQSLGERSSTRCDG